MTPKTSLISSFSSAFRGLRILLSKERNAQIHFSILLFTIGLGIWLKIAWFEWLILLVFFASVISLEALNSAIERLCDLIHPEFDLRIKDIKDISAGAVVWAAILSILAGLIIFLPKLIEQLK